MGEVTLINPVGEVYAAEADSRQIGERLGSLTGKFLGLIDDMKPNAGAFLRVIEGMLKDEFLLRGTHTVRKNVTPNMAIAHELEEAVQGAVVAWGD